MPRLLLVVVLAVHVALTASEASGTELGACVEQCPDDDAQGNCAASCTDCTSCPHAQTFMATAGVKSGPASVGDRVPKGLCRVPATPEPAEILHVPKTVRA